ncbi:hypothetical protein F5B21DRAFT_472704 [Xylaria acuta]|nr:hypothetical protein F5B21DRAFT_472704 [Xylaria acuta]
MMRVRVNSQVVDWADSGLHTLPCSDSARQNRRKVLFSDDTATLSGPQSQEHGSMLLSQERSSTDLSQRDNLSGKELCSALTRDTLRPLGRCSSICLGFIDNCSNETLDTLFTMRLNWGDINRSISCRCIK